jgi:hypothetical protein
MKRELWTGDRYGDAEVQHFRLSGSKYGFFSRYTGLEYGKKFFHRTKP